MNASALAERVIKAGDSGLHEVLDGVRKPLALALRAALIPAYAGGWAAGEDAATDALHRKGMLTKADNGDDEYDMLDLGTDWEAWSAGDLDAAGITEGAGLKALLERSVGSNEAWASRAGARGSMLSSIADNRIGRLATVITDELSHGYSVGSVTAAIEGVLDDPSWASVVANTEIARAVTAASIATYAANGVQAKEFLTAVDQRVCPACDENEATGPVPISADFPNGDPPVHPSCRCALTPASMSVSDALLYTNTLEPEDML